MTLTPLLFLILTASPDSHTLDAWLSTKAEIALATSDVRSADIHIDTQHGVVMLVGKVPTAENRAAAESVVAKLKQVQRVDNRLQVVPERFEKIVQAYDDEIKRSAIEALAKVASLHEGKIRVGSVNNGILLLEGSAVDIGEHACAVNVVRKVAGVRRVETRVEVQNDALVTTFYYPTVGRDLSNPKLHDMWLTLQVKEEFLADAEVPVFEVRVDTTDAGVTLFGAVGTQAAKNAAERDAKKVKGVFSVTNELIVDAKLVAGETKKKIGDADLAASVKRLLADEKAPALKIDVNHGVVKLSGKVGSEEQRTYLGYLTRGATGARAVRNDLEVSRQATR